MFVKLPELLQSSSTVTSRFWLLAFGAFALLSASSRGIAADQVGNTDRIAIGSRQRSARMPEGLAKAFHAVFNEGDEKTMESLLGSESSTIALRAAWRLAELRCAERPDSRPLVRFLGFVEGRTKSNLPDWWEALVLGSRFDPTDRQMLRPYSDVRVDDDERYHAVDFGGRVLIVPPSVEIKEEGDSVLWTDSEVPTRIPRRKFEVDGVSLGNVATMKMRDERIYLVVADDTEGSFRLSRLKSTGEELWSGMGWGTGEVRGNGSGLWGATCEIQLLDNEVVVFGGATFGLFAEAFKTDSGEPLYRFCTRYIDEQDLSIGERKGVSNR